MNPIDAMNSFNQMIDSAFEYSRTYTVSEDIQKDFFAAMIDLKEQQVSTIETWDEKNKFIIENLVTGLAALTLSPKEGAIEEKKMECQQLAESFFVKITKLTKGYTGDLKKIEEHKAIAAEARKNRLESERRIEESKNKIEESKNIIEESKNKIEESKNIIEKSKNIIEKSKNIIAENQNIIAAKQEEIKAGDESLALMEKNLLAKNLFKIFSLELPEAEYQTIYHRYLADGAMTIENTENGKHYQINSMKPIISYLSEHPEVAKLNFKPFKSHIYDVPAFAEFLKTNASVKLIGICADIAAEARKALDEAVAVRATSSQPLAIKYLT